MIPKQDINVPVPEHQSIFGDTYHGVPNPLIPHTHPYPTRFHGPVYGVPRFDLPYQQQSWNAPSGLVSPGAGCMSCSGFLGLGDVSASASFNLSAGGGSGSGSGASLDPAEIVKRINLANTVVALIENRSAKPLNTGMSDWIRKTISLGLFYGTALGKVVDATTLESQGQLSDAAKLWGTLAQTMSTVSNKDVNYAKFQTMKSMFETFQKEDAGGKKLVFRVVPRLIVKSPTSTPTSEPMTAPAPATLEEEGLPWLWIGLGVVAVGTAGYFVLKK